jgi:NADH-quinone oxidoreductase subunit E
VRLAGEHPDVPVVRPPDAASATPLPASRPSIPEGPATEAQPPASSGPATAPAPSTTRSEPPPAGPFSAGPPPASSRTFPRLGPPSASLEAQIGELRRTLATRAGEIERAHSALERSGGEAKRLSGEVAQLTTTLARAERERVDAAARADRTERALVQAQTDLTKLQGQHESLRSLLALRAERIRELEGAAAAAESRAQQQASELERLRSLLPPPGDDLQAIYGIGPVFSRKLREQGVHWFAQIASWNEQEVDRMAALLGVHPARIHFDRWVESAATLAGTKNDSEPAT